MHKLLLLGVLWSTVAVAAEPAPQKFALVTVAGGIAVGTARFHSTGGERFDDRLGCHEPLDFGPAPVHTAASPGELSVELGGSRWVYQADSEGYYHVAHDHRRFREGEPLHFHATGADVPAFDATVRAPGPVLVGGLDAQMSRDHDWQVDWVGGSTGIVELAFHMKNGSPNLRCRFRAEAHHGTIPAALLQKLPAGKLRLRTNVISPQTFHVRGWLIRVVGLVMQPYKEVPVIDLR